MAGYHVKEGGLRAARPFCRTCWSWWVASYLCIISVDHFIFIATSHKATMAVLKLPVYYALAASW